MADAFGNLQGNAEGKEIRADKAGLMRELRPTQRQLLGLFADRRVVFVAEIAEYLGISPRQVREQCAKWTEEGFLEIENASKKASSYRLEARFEAGLI